MFLWLLCLPASAFQSTPPARGATNKVIFVSQSTTISIHAPREGGDVRPHGKKLQICRISIHAPREGGDEREWNENQQDNISIHAPREGGDVTESYIPKGMYISIHAPREGGDSKDAQFYL